MYSLILGHRWAPAHPKPSDDMAPHLAAQAEGEPSVGERLQVPGYIGYVRRAAGEGQRDRRPELYLAGALGRQRQGQKGVVGRLAGGQEIEAELFSPRRGLGNCSQRPGAKGHANPQRSCLLTAAATAPSWVGSILSASSPTRGYRMPREGISLSSRGARGSPIGEVIEMGRGSGGRLRSHHDRRREESSPLRFPIQCSGVSVGQDRSRTPDNGGSPHDI